MKTLKLLLSIGILICMFLPLSQSSLEAVAVPAENVDITTVIKKHNKETTREKVIFIEQVLQEESQYGYWAIISFILPLLLNWHIYKKRKISKKELALQTIYCAWLALFLYSIFFSPFYEAAWGGYLLLTFGFMYLILTTIEWYTNITSHLDILSSHQENTLN